MEDRGMVENISNLDADLNADLMFSDAYLEQEESRVYPITAISAIRKDFLDNYKRDLKKTTRDEVRYMVQQLYGLQNQRMQSKNRVQALVAKDSPRETITWLADQAQIMEDNIKKLMQYVADSHPIGEWAQSIPAVGPITTAALMAHIDITKAATAGAIWSFAGLNPDQKWLGKSKATELVEKYIPNREKVTTEKIALIAEEINRPIDSIMKQLIALKPDAPNGNMTKTSLIKVLSRRPWNADLKVVCWKLGESFQKNSGRLETKKGPNEYSKVYLKEKARIIKLNEAGEYEEYALGRSKTVGTGTEAYKAYSVGKIPPLQIINRAKRYAVKLFLAHYHHVAYELEYGTLPPKPYILDQPGHTHYIAPPNWPMKG